MIATISTSHSTWTQTTLGEFCGQRGQSIEPSRTPDSKFELYSVPSFPTGQPELVLGKEVGSNKQLVRSDSVLLCKINPRINRAWVVGNFSRHTKIASTEWIVFPPDERVEPKFLSFFLQQNAVRDFLASNVSGVGGSLMRVKPSTLRDFPFAYPERDEQRSIVAEIEKQFSRLDEAVASLKRTKANLKHYKASVLKAAIEGKLTEDWRKQHPNVEPASKFLERILVEGRVRWTGRGKYKEPTKPEIANLPSLPEGWTWASFEQLCRVQGGYAFKSSDYVKDGIPLTRISNLENGRVQFLHDTVFLPEAFANKYKEFLLHKGDILIAMSGATTGKMATVEDNVQALLNQRVGRFILSSEKLCNLKFVSFVVMQISQKVLKDAYGAAQPNISPSEIEMMLVPLPPLSEQEGIVAEVERRLSVIEELEATVEANRTRADRLRQSIIGKAFQGKLIRHGQNLVVVLAEE